MEQILTQGFAELGLDISQKQLEAFRGFYNCLEETNKVMNLTAISGEEDTARLHFLDCAALLKELPFDGKTVIDVGTGAGFPGMPLLIACPGIRKMTLLDSLGKRIDFLSACCAGLGITNAEPIHARAEEAVSYREQYDAAVSRAVARLSVLCELALPFVKVGGYFAAMKGPNCGEEVREAENAIELLGGKLERVTEYTIPGTDINHSIVLIKKQRSTPKKYPRRFAIIKKTPL
ncbi:MAG: 16S rRNA (guanine(527)-N(7))-methyltransferase RsmG [Candidatus Heteroscillospira sp.]|jgi:16S rRNA (guanine527-N7)-methyltransferase